MGGRLLEFDGKKLDELIKEMKGRPGIVEVLAELFEGKLVVGEDIMYVLVAGEIRDNVFPVLEETVNRIKKEILNKEEDIV